MGKPGTKSNWDTFKEELAKNAAKYVFPAVIFIVAAIIFIGILGMEISTAGIDIFGVTINFAPPTEILYFEAETPFITETPLETETPFITKTPLKTETPIIPPDRVVRDYFEAINDGNYITAWGKLHEGVKEFSVDFDHYKKDWETNIDEVIIDELETIYIDSEKGQGEIIASLTYVHFTFETSNEYRLCFILNERKDEWLIYTQRLSLLANSNLGSQGLKG